jgi:hypothetical protein
MLLRSGSTNENLFARRTSIQGAAEATENENDDDGDGSGGPGRGDAAAALAAAVNDGNTNGNAVSSIPGVLRQRSMPSAAPDGFAQASGAVEAVGRGRSSYGGGGSYGGGVSGSWGQATASLEGESFVGGSLLLGESFAGDEGATGGGGGGGSTNTTTPPPRSLSLGRRSSNLSNNSDRSSSLEQEAWLFSPPPLRSFRMISEIAPRGGHGRGLGGSIDVQSFDSFFMRLERGASSPSSGVSSGVKGSSSRGSDNESSGGSRGSSGRSTPVPAGAGVCAGVCAGAGAGAGAGSGGGGGGGSSFASRRVRGRGRRVKPLMMSKSIDVPRNYLRLRRGPRWLGLKRFLFGQHDRIAPTPEEQKYSEQKDEQSQADADTADEGDEGEFLSKSFVDRVPPDLIFVVLNFALFDVSVLSAVAAVDSNLRSVAAELADNGNHPLWEVRVGTRREGKGREENQGMRL